VGVASRLQFDAFVGVRVGAGRLVLNVAVAVVVLDVMAIFAFALGVVGSRVRLVAEQIARCV